MLTDLSRADVVLVVPPGAGPLDVGMAVEAIVLDRP